MRAIGTGVLRLIRGPAWTAAKRSPTGIGKDTTSFLESCNIYSKFIRIWLTEVVSCIITISV